MLSRELLKYGALIQCLSCADLQQLAIAHSFDLLGPCHALRFPGGGGSNGKLS